MSNEPAARAAKVAEETAASPVVIDLGKQKRKRVKDLRKGKPGRLMDEIHTAIEALKAEGTIAASAQPVIVVVRERSRKAGWMGA
jgi:hypothetical protein